MQNEQKSRIPYRTRHYHSNLPKGSYHSYCRQRFNQLYLQIQSKINRTNRNIKSFQTNRQHNQKRSPLHEAQTFQQYLSRFQPTNKKQRNISDRRLTADHHTAHRSTNTKQNKKIQNEQIIQSHLPFYKCKIDKTQPLHRKTGFRVKQNKFKVVKNAIETNLINYMGQSMQLTSY